MCLAVPGHIVELSKNDIAKVDINGNIIEASTRLAPQTKVGDYVLIHAGFIMEIIDADEARKTIDLFKQLEPPGAD